MIDLLRFLACQILAALRPIIRYPTIFLGFIAFVAGSSILIQGSAPISNAIGCYSITAICSLLIYNYDRWIMRLRNE